MDAGLWLAVFLGTGLGGWTRAAVSAHLTQRFPGPWPWGTLTVNLFGSFLIGILTAYSFTWEGPGRTLPLLFAVTGFCGGVTTYSTLAWQTVGLWQEKDRGRALAFYGLNIGGALVLVLVGFWIGGGMLKNNWSPGALVFAGSGLGGVSRLVVVMAWPASLHGYAWGILGVNLIGCFLIGFLGQRMLAAGKEENKAFVQVFWITGFCGGFTTVSIFSRQTLALGEILSPELSLLYLGGHLLFCPLMVVGGMVLAKHGASKGGQDR